MRQGDSQDTLALDRVVPAVETAAGPVPPRPPARRPALPPVDRRWREAQRLSAARRRPARDQCEPVVWEAAQVLRMEGRGANVDAFRRYPLTCAAIHLARSDKFGLARHELQGMVYGRVRPGDIDAYFDFPSGVAARFIALFFDITPDITGYVKQLLFHGPPEMSGYGVLKLGFYKFGEAYCAALRHSFEVPHPGIVAWTELAIKRHPEALRPDKRYILD